MIDRDEHYDATIDQIRDAYEGKILKLLRRIAAAIQSAGYYADDPMDMSADEYVWSFCCWTDREAYDLRDFDKCIDVKLEIAEARVYGDDETMGGYGLNFGLNIVAYDGDLIGGLTPYNYTEHVWVDARDALAVLNRWAIFENADLAEVATLIAEWEPSEGFQTGS